MRRHVTPVAKTRPCQRVAHARLTLCQRRAAPREAVFEIFFYSGVEQVGLLVDIDYFAPPRLRIIGHRRGLPAESKRALIRGLKPGRDPQQRGLAAAVGAGQHVATAGLEFELRSIKQHALPETLVERRQRE